MVSVVRLCELPISNDSSGSLMGSILAMDHYQNVFNTGMDGPKVSVVTSLYTVYVLPDFFISSIN